MPLILPSLMYLDSPLSLSLLRSSASTSCLAVGHPAFYCISHSKTPSPSVQLAHNTPPPPSPRSGPCCGSLTGVQFVQQSRAQCCPPAHPSHPVILVVLQGLRKAEWMHQGRSGCMGQDSGSVDPICINFSSGDANECPVIPDGHQ